MANYVLDSQKTFTVSPYPMPSVHVAPGCASGSRDFDSGNSAARVYLAFTTLSGGPVWMGNSPDVRVGAFAGTGTVSPTTGPGDITAEWWATSDATAQFRYREIVLVRGGDSVFVSRLPTVDLTGVVAGLNGPTLTVRT